LVLAVEKHRIWRAAVLSLALLAQAASFTASLDRNTFAVEKAPPSPSPSKGNAKRAAHSAGAESDDAIVGKEQPVTVINGQ